MNIATSGTLARGALAILAALTLASCAPKPSIFDGQNPGVSAKDIRVTQVAVTVPEGTDARVQAEIEKKVIKHMHKCATGPRPHTLEVTVEKFEDGSSALAFLVGSSASLDTYSAFVDELNGNKTTIATFQDKFGGGGLIGAAAMANAPGTLAYRLIHNLCEEVFGVTLELDYDPDGSSPSG